MVGRSMKVVLQAALFLARGADQSAEFGFEKEMLTFLGAKSDDQSDSALRKLGDFHGLGFAAGAFFRRFFGFPVRHVGGIVLQDESKRSTVSEWKSTGGMWRAGKPGCGRPASHPEQT